MKNIAIWIAALALGALIGTLGVAAIDQTAAFVATVYTRLFQLLAVPTIVLAVINTLAGLSHDGQTGRLFGRTLLYTLLTTLVAAAVGALLYVAVAPASLSLPEAAAALPEAESTSYADHLVGVVPNNMVRPLLEGNVLSLLLLAFAVGFALSRMPQTQGRQAVLNLFAGLQELLFVLIRGLIRSLPLGIVAFAAQLSAQLSAGIVAASLGRYVAVVLGAGAIQFFVVLPLFLLARGINPLTTLSKMMPAVLMALFTKSSAATLPVTMQTAEQRLGVRPQVARFVLPVCTTINMNGCAAFILVTSLFVMQCGGHAIDGSTILLWLLVSVVSAIGNAGVPMGCFFLTLSLMSGIGAPVAVMGIILPVYTIIDMIETAENVWSDSCVCAMTNKDLAP